MEVALCHTAGVDLKHDSKHTASNRQNDREVKSQTYIDDYYRDYWKARSLVEILEGQHQGLDKTNLYGQTDALLMREVFGCSSFRRNTRWSWD